MTGDLIAGDHPASGERFLAGLNRIAGGLEQAWAEDLSPVAAEVAELLASPRCVILLGREGTDCRVAGAYPAHDPSPSFLFAAARQLAEAAEATAMNGSHFTSAAERPEQGWTGDFIAAPILSSHSSAGALFIDRSEKGRSFSRKDVVRLGAVGLVLGQALQIAKLQGLLRSRFVQTALAGKPGSFRRKGPQPVNLDTGRAARIVARTFYREMAEAGFSAENIIDAATEILSQLGNRVKRCHRRRS